MKGYGKRISEFRKASGMTQEQLGSEVGVTGVAIMRYEKELREPSLEQFKRIARVLGCSVSELIEEIDTVGETQMTVGEKIQGIRLQKGLKQKDLAALAGVPTITLQQYERGVTKQPRLEQLQKIAAALDTPISFFLNTDTEDLTCQEQLEQKKFYFTYGAEGQPFYGGWTEVEAPDGHSACAAFRAYHPDKTEGLLNCSSVYDEDHFKTTEMYQVGNFGYRCHEVIRITRTEVPQ